MENDELKAYIDGCNQSLSTAIPMLYEASFFKIYVKFQAYLSNVFENYCVGIASGQGYCPQRKLAFTDKEHLRAILKGDKQYVEYIKKIEALSKHIFIDNPFNIIFDVTDNLTVMNQMMALRNYIAHESGESKTKYIKTCLGNGQFVEPAEYLIKKNRRLSKSNYTIFIGKIVELSDMILERPLV
ncbi:hypothetical protein [[Clostridium] hylemonae]|uniref:hypothetical protein n=1 Tax=[Clostridium] hylemonae TaxID=89153 RepID=UPI001FCB2E90|nr:hypothetical protein [[Clostridium] hylemonae]BDF05476.1 hypothetical protein CE91St63_25380 [[Clostridium] hylemonae]